MTDWKKVLTTYGGIRVYDNNRVDYLVDGWATYAAMCEAIRTTFKKEPSYYIYLLAWWLDDQFPLVQNDSESTIEKLFRKASTEFGVQIRVMLWKNYLAGAPDLANKLLDFAKQNILPRTAPMELPVQLAQLIRYNNLPTGAMILDDFLPTPFQAHHEKVLIVKGQRGLIGFCGGLDISEDRVKQVDYHTDSPFHDVHCRIQGDAVCELINVFVNRWQAHPESKATNADPKKGDALRGLNDCVPRQQKVGGQSAGIAQTVNAYKNGKWLAKELSVGAVFAAAIGSARRFIYIEDQYMVNLEAAEMLQTILPRIQHLTILIPDFADLPFYRIYRAKFWNSLTRDKTTASKVRVFHRNGGAHSYIHSKTWIIDDELAIIGSPNCNHRGWIGDSEVAVAIFDKSSSTKDRPFAQKLRMHLWHEHLDLGEGQLYDGTLVRLWDEAANAGRVRRYTLEYPEKDKIKDAALLTLLRKSTQEIWDTFVDPLPKPYPKLQE